MRLATLNAAVAVISTFSVVLAVNLDVNSADSISQASSVLARTMLAYYTNGQPSTPAEQVGIIQVPPLYWWESGAVWGGMVDYWAYTGDETYVGVTQQALLAQIGPDRNYEPPAFRKSIGNDDQAFWALSTLSALEYDFPVPSGQPSSLWLDLSVAVFQRQIARWDTSTCGGGLRWQIYSDMNGYEYKNTVSNGALFQIAGRLARYTGEQIYIDWSNKIWDWMLQANFMDAEYNVYDGAQITDNCANINRIIWTYNTGLMLYGSAMLYSHTGSDTWRERTLGLNQAATRRFFDPPGSSGGILYERACEPIETCSYDQFAFKAFLARWMAKSAIVAPFISGDVLPLLSTSAQAAAQACTGGSSGSECGTKWYTGGYDGGKAGIPSVGQALSGMETIQSLLLLKGSAKRSTPIANAQAAVDNAPVSSSSTSSTSSSQGQTSTSTTTPPPTTSSSSTRSSVTTSSSVIVTSSVRSTSLLAGTSSTDVATFIPPPSTSTPLLAPTHTLIIPTITTNSLTTSVSDRAFSTDPPSTTTPSTTSTSSTRIPITSSTSSTSTSTSSTSTSTSSSRTSSTSSHSTTSSTSTRISTTSMISSTSDPVTQIESPTSSAPAPPTTSSGSAAALHPVERVALLDRLAGLVGGDIPLASIYLLAGLLFI